MCPNSLQPWPERTQDKPNPQPDSHPSGHTSSGTPWIWGHWRVPSHILRKSSIWRAPIINGNICNNMTVLTILTMLILGIGMKRFDNILYGFVFWSYWWMIFVKLIKTSAWWCIVHNDLTMLSTLDKPRSKLHRPHDDRASSNRHCGSTIINTSFLTPWPILSCSETKWKRVIQRFSMIHFMEQLP